MSEYPVELIGDVDFSSGNILEASVGQSGDTLEPSLGQGNIRGTDKDSSSYSHRLTKGT